MQSSQIAGFLALCFLTSCSLLGRQGNEPVKTPEGPSYLEGGSPTQLSTSPGTETVLEALRNATAENKALEAKFAEAETELANLRLRLTNVEQQRDEERSARLAAEAQQLEASKRLRDREARLLDLSLKHAKTERELIEMKIQALEAGLRPTESTDLARRSGRRTTTDPKSSTTAGPGR